MPWALAKGPHEGLRPASMWQWPVPDELLKKGLRTNSAGAKKSPCAVPDFVYEGVPCYDEKRYYTGPLPSAANLGFMFQRNAKGPFKTSSSEKWPARMCHYWRPPASTAGEGGPLPDTFPGHRC